MEEMKNGAAYTSDMDKDRMIKYLEAAVEVQSERIKNQRQQLARWNMIYAREVNTTKIREAAGFLKDVIIQKIKRYARAIF